MARRKVIYTQPKIEKTYPILKELGLNKGDIVRFRKSDSGHWLEAEIYGDNKDGSLTLVAKGKMRSIMPEYCELKTEGPRGGDVWVNLKENND